MTRLCRGRPRPRLEQFEFRPVTAAEWDDLAAFFVTQPACST